MKKLLLGLIIACLAICAHLEAAVITVPAGGDIQAAIDQTTEGDTVLVSGGTYSQNFYLPSEHYIKLIGDGEVFIDNATAICSDTPEGTQIEGLEFTGSNGAGITTHNGAHLLAQAIRISGRNSSPAMFCSSGGNVVIENCEFSGNQNDIRAYATRSGSFGLIEVRNCTFVGNHDSFEPQLIPYIGEDGLLAYELEEVDASRDQNYGGALKIELGDGQVNYEDCFFFENGALSLGSVIYNRTANVAARHCSFIGNYSGNGSIYWGSVDDNWGSDYALFENCLFVGNAAPGQEVIHSDNLTVDNNAAWPHNHGLSSAVVVDPLFCDPDGGDFRLGDESYCLPENNPSGERIGAFSAGNCAGVDVTPVQQPSNFDLLAYPNPFNPSTTISFSLPAASHVNLTVYNMAGSLVATLADGMMPAGKQEVGFDASSMSSGMYIYTLMANGQVTTGKVLLVK
ncbi:T9SS type A sorting domain-containing protein [Patescibacteria group bacterium]|nr:T9SS type A sorting domain-containing protein [Patescibacteria group bacterium]